MDESVQIHSYLAHSGLIPFNLSNILEHVWLIKG